MLRRRPTMLHVDRSQFAADLAAATKARVYSYTRFSTPEQALGDSHRRQTDAAAKWASKRGLILDETLAIFDEGVSAFRGSNTGEDRGLGRFLFACRHGMVPTGSYFLVESLDRVSRMAPRRAQRLLDDIVDAGVTIVTLNDGQEYTADRLDNDPTALLIALMVAWRAHEESKTKAPPAGSAGPLRAGRSSPNGVMWCGGSSP
jgi:DNA invertase Pin-like site-specific DNA recombinase